MSANKAFIEDTITKVLRKKTAEAEQKGEPPESNLHRGSRNKDNDPTSTPPRQTKGSLFLDPNLAWGAIKAEQEFSAFPTKFAVRKEDNDSANSWEGHTRIVCMSDTHGKHRDVAVPRGDVLVHGGDFTNTGEPEQVEDLGRYFGELPVPKIVCIAGNHDLTFQPDHYAKVSKRFHGRQPLDADKARSALTNCTYLEDESCTVAGLRVYGSPWQPEFYDWAFNLPRGVPCQQAWAKIPTETDVLVTHGPPLGRGDLCNHGGRAGCFDLLREVQDRVKPRLHVFGHIHEGYGVSFDGTTLFVNASNMTFGYASHHPCIVVDLPHDPTRPAMVVEPVCALSPPEVIAWLKRRGYDVLVPFFEKVRPALGGAELVAFQKDWFYDLSNRLGITSREQAAMGCLGFAMMQLRAESYG